MKYSIKEIVKAWEAFTSPKWIVDGKEIQPEDLEKTGGVLKVDSVSDVHQIDIDYSKWINYLISEEWK